MCGFFIFVKIAPKRLEQFLAHIISRYAPLLPRAQLHCLINHPGRIAIKAISVAVRTNHNLDRNDGIASLTNLVGNGIICDLAGFGETVLLGGIRHQIKKA